MVESARLESEWANFSPREFESHSLRHENKCGEMTEWTKVHDWKSCVPFKRGTEGSNPSLSAMKKVILGRTRWGGSGAL